MSAPRPIGCAEDTASYLFSAKVGPNPTGLARAPRYLYLMLLRRVAFPDFCEPGLPSPAEKPPAGAGWLHEIKLERCPRAHPLEDRRLA